MNQIHSTDSLLYQWVESIGVYFQVWMMALMTHLLPLMTVAIWWYLIAAVAEQYYY